MLTYTVHAASNMREFDLVVFGATGFTGKFVAKELYRLQSEKKRSLKWAAAGRSETKVRTCLEGMCVYRTLSVICFGACCKIEYHGELGGDIFPLKFMIHQEHVKEKFFLKSHVSKLSGVACFLHVRKG